MTGALSLPAAGISEREAEVFVLLGGRLTHAQIGARLFISVRTVESHVASLRRKLGLPEHDALVRLAVEQHRRPVSAALPTALTSFVGRAREVGELAEALEQARLVSAVGPGGFGKTRLAVAVAASAADRFAGGVGYIDLAPVTDPALVAAGVAAALGTGEFAGRATEDALLTAVGDAEILLVLDNCEHVANSAARLSELLLSRCPRMRILVTSRTRLVLPFERVYQVGGLSVDDDGGGDAVALFLARAEGAGAPVSGRDVGRAARICRALDGGALAIELAAARLPSLGLDGLERGLADHLGLLSGGGRLQPRHRSLRDTLDWSYQLLDPVDQAMLRRVSVFAAPFDSGAAVEVTTGGPVSESSVLASLARLVEHSLVMVVPYPAGTRYRLLETVRQYGGEQLRASDDPAYERHLDWCLSRVAALADDTAGEEDVWTWSLDLVADDLRAALGWAVNQPARHDDARMLAELVARVLFHRGQLGEAQRRYTQAAELTDDPAGQAAAFATAAAVAKCRVLGEEAIRLERAAAEAYLRAGDGPSAAATFADCAAFVCRFRGMFESVPGEDAVQALLAEARRHAGDDPRAAAAICAAEAHAGDSLDPATHKATRHAIELARAVGDRVLEVGLHDELMFQHLMAGEITEQARASRDRLELALELPHDPIAALEVRDGLHNAVFSAIGEGNLTAAVSYGRQHAALPFLRQARDAATEDILHPLALAGYFDEALTLAAEFRDAWERAGRHVAPGRGLAPAAIAMVHGIRGDEDGRGEWLSILARIRGVPDDEAIAGSGYGEVFDAIALLHHGRHSEAYDELVQAEEAWRFYGKLFAQWRAALRTEAAVLAGRTDSLAEIDRAAAVVIGNPVATAIVQRARALHAGDTAWVAAAAADFDAAGCPYQRDRTLSLTTQ